jgi:hypothetical protein
MSKLRVNSLWGKYVQQDVARGRKHLNSLGEYLAIIQSHRIKRDSLQFRQSTTTFLSIATSTWRRTGGGPIT